MADNPETVTKPPAPMETVELRPDVADHVYDESKLVIWVVNPVEVRVTPENAGVRPAANAGVTPSLLRAPPRKVFEPAALPERIVPTVIVEVAPADNPVTVTSPVLEIAAEPVDAEAVHVYAES